MKTTSLENIKLSPNSLLKQVGYKKHTRGYIREELPYGRFHIIVEGRELLLHYDIYITGKNKEHFSMLLPEREREEVKRIVQKLYYYPKIFRKEKKEKERKFVLPEKLKPKVKEQTKPEIPKPKKIKFKPEYANPLEVKKELERIKALRERSWWRKLLDLL